MNVIKEQVLEKRRDSESLTARAALFMAARGLSFALSFGLPLILVRRLNQDQFGLYKQVFLLTLTAINVLPLGIEMSAFYFLPRLRERKERGRVVLNIFIFYILMAGAASVTLCLAPAVLTALFNSEVSRYALAISMMIPLWGAPFLLEILATANEEVRLASALIVCSELGKTILLVGAALVAPTVMALIVAGILHGSVWTLVLLIYTWKRFGNPLGWFQWSAMRAQLSYAMPFGFAAILFRLQTDLHNYYVAGRFDSAAYAIYAIGCFNLPLISILGYSVSGVLIPRVNQLEADGERRAIIELMSRAMRKLAAVYLPAYVLLLVVGREFIEVLFTRAYLPSWPIFAINLAMIPLAIVTTVNDAVMRAHAEHRFFLVRLRLLLIPILLFGLWVLTGRYGLVGAISAVVALSVLEAAATGLKALTILGATRRDLRLFGDLIKVGFASAVAGSSAALIRALLPEREPLVVLMLTSAAFAGAYLAALFSMKIVTPHERAALRHALVNWPRIFGSKREASARP
jgi:O-antigen/teichoic acid export membrane protein